MPHPWVEKATLINGKIVLAIELDEYLAGESVEISGYVTQNNGGFATVYDIQIAEAAPDGSVVMYVTATPSQAFQSGEDVTASLRASRVWATVLTESQDGETPSQYLPASAAQGVPAKDGTSWNKRAVAWASPDPSSTPGDSQESAGNDISFRARNRPSK